MHSNHNLLHKRPYAHIWGRLWIAFISLAVVFITGKQPAHADPLLWNTPANQQSCPVGESAVWAEYEGGAECIRYFFAGDINDAPFVFFRMYGDRGVSMGKPPEDIANNTVAEQRAIAERKAIELGLPVIILARPGTYGSSGDHRERRQKSEFLAINAALNEITQKHRIERLVLSGHSGGATAAAAVLTLGRDDVACAILTSGAFALLERAQRLRERNGKDPIPGVDLTGISNPYDPLEHIAGITDDPQRIILVIGNSQDSSTPFDLQRRFASALADAGHRVSLIEQAAHGPKFHNLRGAIGYTAIEHCAEAMD
ncbi:hypothetical protein [Halomonas sp. SpR8]|uniref:hypothetical protein n=1 Tax=Halomonas sp. SpR8 TaxID=3050463 RepID=UPI0027E4FD5A|nr:hypothetical protein [Halomonas sp. SpR8]MDQ7730977.1 hypothetical protein [Halomonas sp. SpR8]